LPFFLKIGFVEAFKYKAFRWFNKTLAKLSSAGFKKMGFSFEKVRFR